MNETLIKKLDELRSLPNETEWVEFKANYAEPNEIGQYISALSNAALFFDKDKSYVVWGIVDQTHDVCGTDFDPDKPVKDKQPLRLWLKQKLSPVPVFEFFKLEYHDKFVVVLEISTIAYQPVRFDDQAYFRIGSSKVSLKDYPEKERQLWHKTSKRSFEFEPSVEHKMEDEILMLLDCAVYFDLSGEPLPDRRQIFKRFCDDRLLIEEPGGLYSITNLGALLFAKNLESFPSLGRKALRIIQYKGYSRVQTIDEYVSKRGYAAGFEALMEYINSILPHNELIKQALRQEERMYPKIAVRELVANALIHQDLTISGTSPTVEIFDDRLEITNPGLPLIDPLRLIDEQPRSRNEKIAALMRRFKICEERGSGIDKVIFHVELFQLPAPKFVTGDNSLKASLYAYKTLLSMNKEDKVRACYQHACLQYVTNKEMTNASLRKRFGVEAQNYPTASRIINEAIKAKLVKPKDPSEASKRNSSYVPFWA
jgi:ATP-dependent DNA helicase RecG